MNNHEAILEYMDDKPQGVLARDIQKSMPTRFETAHAVSFIMRSLEGKHLVFRERDTGTSFTRYKLMKYNPNKIINSIWRRDGRGIKAKSPW